MFTSAWRHFRLNQRGTTAIVFALGLVPLAIAAGAAVDYMRFANVETKLQAALDAGALAVASSSPSLTREERLAVGQNSFEMNLAAVGLEPDAIEGGFSLTGSRVEASARYDLPTGFMQIAGLTHMTAAAATTINVPEGKKAEIALVLDYSGSMTETAGGQVKYVAMKEAAKKLISDLEASNPGKVKIGLVPFSHHVYGTFPKTYILGQSGAGTWTGCTQDRRYPYNLTDATPTSDNATKWGQPQALVHSAQGCGAYAPNNLKIAPLADDFTALKSQLDSMRPYAWTHIALGAEFGYHLLSPNEPFAEGAPYEDRRVDKVMVILTDGRQTEPAFGSGTRSVAAGESNLEDICQNAKDSGITVMTVAFDLRDSDTRTRLSDCTSDPARHFFVAEDDAELARAFEDIRTQIASRVYISR
jgi:Flp pilus assembly protein TadG